MRLIDRESLKGTERKLRGARKLPVVGRVSAAKREVDTYGRFS